MSGNQLIIPNLFSQTQSADFNKIKAKPKLIMIVVKVKKILGQACFHLLYLKLNKGIAPSKIQNNVIPPINNILRWEEGMVSK